MEDESHVHVERYIRSEMLMCWKYHWIAAKHWDIVSSDDDDDDDDDD